MTEPASSPLAGGDARQVSRRRSPLFWLLIVLMTAEFVAVAVITVVFIVDLFVAPPVSYAAGIAVIVMAAVASVWLAFMAAAALRGRAWMRGASIVWQVLQFAIGLGCFTGLTAAPAVGWLLVVPAVAVVALLVSRPVVAVTSDRD